VRELEADDPAGGRARGNKGGRRPTLGAPDVDEVEAMGSAGGAGEGRQPQGSRKEMARWCEARIGVLDGSADEGSGASAARRAT
jgi:hypothetical protein